MRALQVSPSRAASRFRTCPREASLNLLLRGFPLSESTGYLS